MMKKVQTEKPLDEILELLERAKFLWPRRPAICHRDRESDYDDCPQAGDRRTAHQRPSRFGVQLKNSRILRWKFPLGCLILDDPSAAKNSTAEFVICRAQCLRRSGNKVQNRLQPASPGCSNLLRLQCRRGESSPHTLRNKQP